MDKSSVIISGEASETDSDNDMNTNMNQRAYAAIPIQGAVISGEDSESEDENPRSVQSAVSVLADFNDKENQTSKTNESLLHKKLVEAHCKFHSEMNGFCRGILNQAEASLAVIDQKLLKSQINLQNAVTNLRTLYNNSELIKERFDSVLTSLFVSGIKTQPEQSTQ